MRFLSNKLLKLAYFYCKIAQSTQLPLPFDPKDIAPTKNNKEQEYEEFVKNLPSTTVKDILIGIDHFYDEPYFNFDEVTESLMRALFKHSQRLGAIKSVVYYDTDLHTSGKIMTYVVKYFIDHFLDQMICKDYLDYIEKVDDLPDNYLRRAQAAALKLIMEWGAEDDHIYNGASQDYLKNLIKKSTKFNKDLLWRVAKHLGPDYYGEVAADLNKTKYEQSNDYNTQNPIDTIMQKEQYNVYDVAELVNVHRRSIQLFSRINFEKILSRADDKAKAYLRRFLYRSDGGIHFILDENMQPMNQDYASMTFPFDFQIMWNWQSVQPLRKIWEPIFNEFKIIPVEQKSW